MANIIEITDLSEKGVEVYSRLTEAQLRNRLEPEKGIFIAESSKVIDVALRSGYKPISILTDRKIINDEAKGIIERCGDIPVYTAESKLLEQLAGFKLTRGLLCAVKRPELPEAEDICKNAKRIAVLENVVDATNIGAIFRSAAALDMDAVLVTPTCCDPFNRRAVRVSMGTILQVPWTYIGADHTEWPHPGLERLCKLGFKTAAMALSSDSVSIDDPKLMNEEKLAIILGAEGNGLSQQTIANCDYVVKIPMSHGVDSLNVAAASAVAFWQLRRK